MWVSMMRRASPRSAVSSAVAMPKADQVTTHLAVKAFTLAVGREDRAAQVKNWVRSTATAASDGHNLLIHSAVHFATHWQPVTTTALGSYGIYINMETPQRRQVLLAEMAAEMVGFRPTG